ALPLGSVSLKVATTPVNGTPAVALTTGGTPVVLTGPLTMGKPLAVGVGSGKIQSSTATRLVVLPSIPVPTPLTPPGVIVVPSNLKMTLLPSVNSTLVTMGLLNSSPAKTAVPGVGLVGTSRVSMTVPLWKKVMVVPGCWTLRKIAPKPRDTAETS